MLVQRTWSKGDIVQLLPRIGQYSDRYGPLLPRNPKQHGGNIEALPRLHHEGLYKYQACSIAIKGEGRNWDALISSASLTNNRIVLMRLAPATFKVGSKGLDWSMGSIQDP